MWCQVGGLQTLGSYGPTSGWNGTLADVPAEHWAFIEEGCQDYYETDTHIFVHANLNPGLPLAEQDETMLFWEFLNKDWPVRHISGKTVVCGHTSQKSGEILDLGTVVCIDTYIYGGGWLTGLDPESSRYWQVSPIGKVRTGILGQPREE
jgi:serine/threonine protein phosphatase 1